MCDFNIGDILEGSVDFNILDFNANEFIPRSLSQTEEESDNASSNASLSGDSDFEQLMDFGFPSPSNFNTLSDSVWGSKDECSQSSFVDRLSSLVSDINFGSPSSDTVTAVPAAVDGTVNFYLDWIDALISLKGKTMTEADLYREMEAANAALYKAINEKYGSCLALLMQHPQRFRCFNSAPFKWSIQSLSAGASPAATATATAAAAAAAPGPSPLGDKPKRARRSSPSRPEAVDDRLIDHVIRTCADVLKDAPQQTLKSVELANALRADVGVEAMAQVKAGFGGLLNLLGEYPDAFEVRRIPKNDHVALRPAGALQCSRSPAEASFAPGKGEDGRAAGGCPVLRLLSTEKWVPGKAWPASPLDAPYLSALAAVLERQRRGRPGAPGRAERVAKLRGLLKLQLRSPSTIKSVPLKALVRAYPAVFTLTEAGVLLARDGRRHQ